MGFIYNIELNMLTKSAEHLTASVLTSHVLGVAALWACRYDSPKRARMLDYISGSNIVFTRRVNLPAYYVIQRALDALSRLIIFGFDLYIRNKPFCLDSRALGFNVRSAKLKTAITA